MNEYELLITGLVGGAISATVMATVFLGHIKFCYDEKLKALQYQIIAIRSELSKEYEE